MKAADNEESSNGTDTVTKRHRVGSEAVINKFFAWRIAFSRATARVFGPSSPSIIEGGSCYGYPVKTLLLLHFFHAVYRREARLLNEQDWWVGWGQGAGTGGCTGHLRVFLD